MENRLEVARMDLRLSPGKRLWRLVLGNRVLAVKCRAMDRSENSSGGYWDAGLDDCPIMQWIGVQGR